MEALCRLRFATLRAARLGHAPAVACCSRWRGLGFGASAASEPAEADISRLLVLGTVGAGAVSAAAWLLRRHGEGPISDRVYPRDWRYLCEGQHFLLCAPKAANKPSDWDGSVLQLRKSPGSAMGFPEKRDSVTSLEWQAGFQRMLSKLCFPPHFLSIPEAVVVPVADIRALDAHLLSARPPDLRKQRLDVQAATGYAPKVQLLRKENLLDAWAPSLSLELSPGCGVKELRDMPSRHSMAHQLVHGKPEPDWNLGLFSKNARECANAVSSSVAESRGCEIFASDGELIAHRDATAREELLQRLGLSQEELVEAAAAVLSSSESALEYLKKLQVFASGNAERLAGEILVELQKRGGAGAAEVGPRC